MPRNAGMPKLPILPMKASIPPAAMAGTIKGNTMVRTMRHGLAPAACAASTRSRGSARRPARTARKTIGACSRPKSRMMPSGPYSGCRVPGGGARPSAPSKVLFGPNRSIHASAVTCGAIISGSMKQKTSGFLPRKSVSVTSSANAPPSITARTTPPSDTVSVLRAARHTAGFSRTPANRAGSNLPPGASASWARRPTGTTASRMTTPRRTRKATRSPREAGIHRMRPGACGSAAEQVGESLLVELVAFEQLADVDRKNLERPDLGEAGRRRHILACRQIPLRGGHGLPFLRKDEVDERTRSIRILRSPDDRGRLGNDGDAFGGKDEVNRRAFGLRVERHEFDDDAVHLLAARDRIQNS